MKKPVCVKDKVAGIRVFAVPGEREKGEGNDQLRRLKGLTVGLGAKRQGITDLRDASQGKVTPIPPTLPQG